MTANKIRNVIISKTPSLSLWLRLLGFENEFILVRVWCAVDARLVCV